MRSPRFAQVSKHRFFNTNNLWVNLEALKATFAKFKGVMPLAVMQNSKTVDPRDKKSQMQRHAASSHPPPPPKWEAATARTSSRVLRSAHRITS